MDAAGWIAIAFLVVMLVLAWRFNALEFTMKALGFEGSAKASRTGDGADKAGGTPQSGAAVQATGDGAVAVGGGADEATIETKVRKDGEGEARATGPAAQTAATGDGAVAIGGGAKGAKIKTDVRKGDADT